jgi:hypothetical protein
MKILTCLSYLVLLTVILTTGCGKRCIPESYTLYAGTSNLFPNRDSLRVGDTLLISITIPVKLKSYSYNNTDSVIVDMTGASNIATDIHFNAFPKADTLIGALDCFKIIPSTGQISVNPLAPDAAETVYFNEVQNEFVTSFRIVAQKRGVYCITILDIGFAMKKCIQASITIPMANSLNQHLNYLDSIYFPGSRYEPSIPGYELTHDYCFKVY